MIVAIGRELGAGGRDVGERVAQQLGAELLDNQIIDLVAARIGAPTAYVEARDENVESFVDRLFRVITSAYPEAYAAEGLPDWSEERMVQLTGSIIQEHATGKPLVVIGRGAPMLLRDRADALRTFITAPTSARVARLRERTGCTADDAAKEIKKSDQHRLAYMQQYYGVNWRDPSLYDIIVNTEHLGLDGAAQLIVEASRRRSG
ncbi:MAG TPA: cytidylate kinase-like family protein [Candidatus Acidoferrales bacterium]|nr:cytidylate kinase-like family protein [Candidatus Acidoferrales bacterium]